MCAPFILASAGPPLPAPPLWLACCLQCTVGACVPRKKGVPRWPGKASENSHSRAQPFSLKAIGYPGGKPRRKGSFPSPRPPSPRTSVGQDRTLSLRPGLFQGVPQLKAKAQPRRNRASWGLRIHIPLVTWTLICPSSPPLACLRPFCHSASTQGQVARGRQLKTWCGIFCVSS